MALRDDLANSDSYYIVEIKSLKRILDAVGKKAERFYALLMRYFVELTLLRELQHHQRY